MKLIAAAIATVDDSGNLVIDREELITAIRTVGAFEGLTGAIKCDGMGEWRVRRADFPGYRRKFQSGVRVRHGVSL